MSYSKVSQLFTDGSCLIFVRETYVNKRTRILKSTEHVSSGKKKGLLNIDQIQLWMKFTLSGKAFPTTSSNISRQIELCKYTVRCIEN